MSDPNKDLRERVWTVPKMPFLNPQKALNWVLGRKVASWKSVALCPLCDSVQAFMNTYSTPDGNIWMACSRCGVRSFYEALMDLGVTEFREIESITRDCGGQEIDTEWTSRITLFLEFRKIIETRIKWLPGIDAGISITRAEAQWFWSGMLGTNMEPHNKTNIHLRILYSLPGRISCVIPYYDINRTRRMAELPALYFDNLGPSLNVDVAGPIWKRHLLIGVSWEHIYARLEDLRGKLCTDDITPLRMSERCESPVLMSPNPVRWLSTVDHRSVPMMEIATSFPPNTRLSALSFRRDRLPAISSDMLAGKPKTIKGAKTLRSLIAASNGHHANPITRTHLLSTYENR